MMEIGRTETVFLFEGISRIKSGNLEDFQVLVNIHQNRVINICFGFLKNKEDAEDIAQEVFMEVYKSIFAFRKEAKLSTWIYRISVRKSLDFIRKKKTASNTNILAQTERARETPP